MRHFLQGFAVDLDNIYLDIANRLRILLLTIISSALPGYAS